MIRTSYHAQGIGIGQSIISQHEFHWRAHYIGIGWQLPEPVKMHLKQHHWSGLSPCQSTSQRRKLLAEDYMSIRAHL